MSKLISEEIVEAVTLGDKEGFMSAFHSAIAAKVSDALEIKKVEIASTLIAPASSEVVEEAKNMEEDDEDDGDDSEEGMRRRARRDGRGNDEDDGDDSEEGMRRRARRDGRGPVEEEVEQIDELSKKTLGSYVKKAYWDQGKRTAHGAEVYGYVAGKYGRKATRGEVFKSAKEMRRDKTRDTGVERALSRLAKEEVEQIDEAMKVSFGRGHSGQPGGDDDADTVATHHGNGLKVKSSIGWDGDHSIDVHHKGKHVGSIFSTHGYSPESTKFDKNKGYKGEIGHKEVKAALTAHQQHPEVQSWLIHNHSDSESEAHNYGKINGHKLHPTAKKYLEKISNDDDRDYEAPYKPETKSAAKPKSSTSGAYEKALTALKKKHGIKEEVEQVDEGTPEAKGQSRAEWRMGTADVIAKNNAKIAAKKALAKKKLLAGKGK